jgi:hypothetical protein
MVGKSRQPERLNGEVERPDRGDVFAVTLILTPVARHWYMPFAAIGFASAAAPLERGPPKSLQSQPWPM